MHYRLSNTADRGKIEKEMGIPFKFPRLYRPRPVINGLEETSVPVITMSEPHYINYAIWGILPEHYNDDWKQFQNIFNTLTLREESLAADLWYSQALRQRRCLMLVSGYYTFRLQNGELLPFYVSTLSGGILSLGGIYNQLDDGFFTCALLIVNANAIVSKVQNIDSGMPLAIGSSMRESWLYPSPDQYMVTRLARHQDKVELQARPVSMERYKNAKMNQHLAEPTDLPDFLLNP
jgi:putative SOS response-associated peptidase YedK